MGKAELFRTVKCTIGAESAFDPLNAELNPIRHLLALVGARHIVHVSRIRVKEPVNVSNWTDIILKQV
jgi:hypothetical protein